MKRVWYKPEEKLPTWREGVVDVKIDDKIYYAIFNELGLWWRVYVDTGVIRIDIEDERITEWSYKEQ